MNYPRLRQESDLSEILDATDYIDADIIDDLDGEEIRAIAGRSISSSSGESLIMHLVNAQKPKNEDSGSETFSIRISNKDVNVITEDGHEIPDVDLEIEIPKEKLKKSNTFRRRVRSLVNRLTKHKDHQEVMIIKDKVQVKDENGKVYDLDLDLKVEMDNLQNEKIRKEMKKTKKEEQLKAKKEKEQDLIRAKKEKEQEIIRSKKEKEQVLIKAKKEKEQEALLSKREKDQGQQLIQGRQQQQKLNKKKRSNSLRRLMCPINAPWSRSRRNIAWNNSSDEDSISSSSEDSLKTRRDLSKSTTLPAIASTMAAKSAVNAIQQPATSNGNCSSGQKVRSLTDLSHLDNNNGKTVLIMSCDPNGSNGGGFSLQDPVLMRRSTADLFRFTTV